MTRAPLRPVGEGVKQWQRYVDEPVYEEVATAKPLSITINSMGPRTGTTFTFGMRCVQPSEQEIVDQVLAARLSATPAQRQPIYPHIVDLTHYQRVRLRWMKPDGKGGFVPRRP